jgi:hypothetical protein
MTELHIPEQAVAAGATRVFLTPLTDNQVALEIGQIYYIVELALVEAAPLIVAAELRRLFDQTKNTWDAHTILMALHDRARELEGGAS